MKLLLISLLWFSLPALAKAPYVQFGPCGCVWDNSTKEYPKNSKSEGVLFTTVHYQCGYLCKDGSGKTQHILGDHEVSFRGREIGHEVVCDGLSYQGHNNPTGAYGVWTSYSWDGVTRSFDARQSESETLKKWSEQACEGKSPLPRSGGSVSTKIIDELRAEVGLKALVRTTAPAKFQAAKLDEKMSALCRLTPEQTDFVEGLVSRDNEEECSEKNAERMKQNFEDLRLRSFQVRNGEAAREVLKQTEALLLCPYFNSNPSPATLSILGAKVAKALSRPEDKARLRVFACSLGLRGLKSSVMSKELRDSL